jgi:HPt (histidine-containing phosphotransfer) domain-containing protein
MEWTKLMTEKIRVEISKDLEVLIPRYLDRRHKEVEIFRTQLSAGDFEALRIGGHSLKGSGGGYGFPLLTTIGATIESAAKAKDVAAIENALMEYAAYIQRIEVVYV